MKRWIHASADLAKIQAKADELEAFFRENGNDATLVAKINRGSLTDIYTVSRRLSGRGITIYMRTVDSRYSNRSFGGGTTLATGWWYVAQWVMNIEENGANFTVE